MAPDKGSAAAIEQITRSCPVVLLNPRTQVDGCDTVSIANYDGARDVVRHLIGLGHHDIAMVKGPAGNVDAEERLRGYREALRAAGMRPRPTLEIQGDFTESSGYEATRHILGLRPRPTAVFAANDYMAIGLLSALRDAGIEVPSQMAVTGFDDIAIAQYVSPPLTTVRVNAYELGDRAIRLWIVAAQSSNGLGRTHELLPTELVVRESSGAVPPRGSATRPRSGRLRQSESIQPSTSRHSPTARPQTRRRKS